MVCSSSLRRRTRGDILSQDDVEPILVVSLFDGIGALRVAVDALRMSRWQGMSRPRSRKTLEGWLRVGSMRSSTSRTSETLTRTRSAVGVFCTLG